MYSRLTTPVSQEAGFLSGEMLHSQKKAKVLRPYWTHLYDKTEWFGLEDHLVPNPEIERDTFLISSC